MDAIRTVEVVEVFRFAFDLPPNPKDWVEVTKAEFDREVAIQNYRRRNYSNCSYYEIIGMEDFPGKRCFACETDDGRYLLPRAK